MPHVIVEYSSNLEDSMDVGDLLDALHQGVIDSGLADTAAIRTRAFRCEHYRIADRNPENGYVQITVRMREGRPQAALQSLAERLLAAAEKSLERAFAAHPIGLALEVHEITQLTVRRNTIRLSSDKAA
jgi:5-carboxymethyl-2-hydroxymuconate isomerase